MNIQENDGVLMTQLHVCKWHLLNEELIYCNLYMYFNIFYNN